MTKQQNFLAVVLSGAALVAVASLPFGKDNSQPMSDVTDLVPRQTMIAGPEKKSPAGVTKLDDVSQFTRQAVGVKLITSLKADELDDQLAFEGLSTFEPIARVVQRGIVSYERKTFRTPEYRKESGYDLVMYEIRHALGGVSRIMAYLDKPLAEDGLKRELKIVVLTGQDGQTMGELVQFEAKNLAAQKQVVWHEAQGLFDREMLNASNLMRASVQ